MVVVEVELHENVYYTIERRIRSALENAGVRRVLCRRWLNEEEKIITELSVRRGVHYEHGEG